MEDGTIVESTKDGATSEDPFQKVTEVEILPDETA